MMCTTEDTRYIGTATTKENIMASIYDGVQLKAQQMAATAKPGYTTIAGKLYTFEFVQNEWIYRVYEDGFFLVNFNCKALPKAKKMLMEWLQN